MLGLSYTLLRGKFDGNFPNHQTLKVLERGTMTWLGGGYSCNPLLPATTIQTCLSNKYKTQFAVWATGYLRVLPADAKRNVQLLLKATGWARVTFGGTTMSISGKLPRLSLAGWAMRQRHGYAATYHLPYGPPARLQRAPLAHPPVPPPACRRPIPPVPDQERDAACRGPPNRGGVDAGVWHSQGGLRWQA